MATKKVPDTQAPANTPASLAAVHEVFGKHAEDVIDPIEWGVDTLLQLAEVLSIIAETAKNGEAASGFRRILHLAEAGRYLADDMANTMDCEHEDMRDRLLIARAAQSLRAEVQP